MFSPYQLKDHADLREVRRNRSEGNGNDKLVSFSR